MNYELPKKYWEEKDKKGKKMDADSLMNVIEKYIKQHNVMAIATSYDNIVRNTPVEYTYRNGDFYFLSEGGKKFDGLEVNKNVCLAIFDQMSGGVCKGLQVTGIADVIESNDQEYLDFFVFKKLKPEVFSKRLSYSIPLIKVEVKCYDYFDAALTKEKYHMRQHIDFKR